LKVPFHKTHISEDEIEAVVETLRSGWITMGPKTIEFENKFKDFVGSKYATSVNSATAGLHLALKSVGLEKYDEVIIPTNTFVATAEVVTYFGAIPVLCDIEESTHNIDVSKIESLVTKNTKVIIPVHFAGQPCDMDEIYTVAKKYGLSVVEDAAHAIPSSYKGVRIGDLKGTDVTCFSFYATKPLSTGEGGMCVTNNTLYAENIKVNRLHGISQDAWDRYKGKGSWFYDVIDNGFKYNTSDINTSIGIVQLKKQIMLRDKRASIAKKYSSLFKKCKGIVIPHIKSDRESSWHLYVIKVENRDEVIEKLGQEGVGCSVHFIPIHMHTYYKNRFQFQENNYTVANKVFRTSLSLPIYPDMSDKEVHYVASKVIGIVKLLGME